MDVMGLSQLYAKISSLPDDMKSEVNDFIDFLMRKPNSELKKNKPKYGCAKGQIEISDDFDEPLEDFKEYYVANA